MSLAQNQTRQSTIDWIEEGKTWSGKDGTQMKEYKVSLKNGDIPVFNYPSNKTYPFTKGDTVSYILNERMVNNKIIQNGKQMKKVENTQTTQSQAPNQQESIALSVAIKLAKETYESSIWQETLTIEDAKARGEKQSEVMQGIGSIATAYFNFLTTKPQNNG